MSIGYILNNILLIFQIEQKQELIKWATVVPYYVPWRMQEFVKPAKVNITIKNIQIKAPVVVDLLSGKIMK